MFPGNDVFWPLKSEMAPQDLLGFEGLKVLSSAGDKRRCNAPLLGPARLPNHWPQPAAERDAAYY